MMRADSPQCVLTAAIRAAASASSPACVLDTRGAYLFANEAWLAIAAEHGTLRAESLVGSSVLDGLDGEDVRRSWQEALDDVLSGTAPSRSIAGEHNTTTLARLTSTRVEPIVSTHGVLGVVLVRSVVRERPISDLYVVSRRPGDAYEHVDGRVTQCPCCRRARDRADPTAWEIVPRWIAAPPPSARWITCDLCAELHLAPTRAA
ncbi:MAG TPA: hypothetical protein VFK85_00915 [Anaeromyxobacteraceae bacterium]|nr:hypothetical protein [Anaeromyxobacteraceae bacterium]